MINRRQKYRFALLVAFILLTYAASYYQPHQKTESVVDADTQIVELFQNKISNQLVEVSGQVIKLLPDDLKGARHQRFIMALANGHSLLVAHNIDIAQPIADLKVGDGIRLYGEYEWNAKGGVIHWTHHDPDNRHPHGWIRHNGQLYQ